MPDDNLLVEEKERQGYKVKIYVDPDPLDPRREWSNMGTMVCFHKRAQLGDEHGLDRADFNSYDEIGEYIRETEDPVLIFPLYLYQHHRMSMKIGSFSGQLPQGHARFDSGQVGFIYATEEDILENFQEDELSGELKNKAEDVLRGEVETYDKFLRGDVYGFQVVDEHECPECGVTHEEVLDSCWGFHDRDNLMEHAESFIEGYD